MALKRLPASPGGGASSPKPAERCKLAERFPTCWEFLALLTWEDGQSRVPGTVLLFSDAGTFKACLNDRDASMSAFVSGSTLTGLLEAMEKGLLAGSLDWRAKRDDRPKGGKGGR